jgi:hypothetical protein
MRRPSLALAIVFLAAMTGNAVAATAPVSVAVPALDSPPAIGGAIEASWAKAASVGLDMDFTYRRPAEEPTTAYVAQDGSFIDVAFSVTQRAALIATQVTNSSSVLSDDYVGVYFNPQGTTGISYGFFANARSARYQFSSENTNYTPQWSATAKITAKGYDVTMRIPLNIIRSGGSKVWRAQFVRATVATNGLAVWSYSPRAQSPSDPAFEGILTGIGTQPHASARPKPRLQIYGLGELTTAANGGNTSRVGADFSVPVTPTASFVGTLHPDYSNVEVDQQTIAPTAFARQYAEVRPFFTQAGSYFNYHMACDNCPQTLYTPAIPTFSQGYAIEGTQGRATFAAFDALSDGRNDDAQTLNYNYEDPDTSFQFNGQRVGVSYGGLNDVTTTVDTGYTDQKLHLFGYLNTGQDRGTNVTDPAIGNYVEAGGGYSDATSVSILSYQSVGAQFDPVDGYVAQTDINGYEWFNSKTLNFSPGAPLHDIAANFFYARYNNRFDQLAQTDSNGQVNFDFRDLISVHVYAGSSGIRTFDDELLPFGNNGLLLGYKINTATPTYVAYTSGAYYHGSLDEWNYFTTIPLIHKVHLSLETDEDQYLTDWPGETTTRQWLERASLDWQFNRDASFDVGVRRIIGQNLPNSYEPISYGDTTICFQNPYNPGCYVDASNVTLAFHFLASKNEFYLVYGDANDLSTEPALFLKWIRYIGAEKGT